MYKSSEKKKTSSFYEISFEPQAFNIGGIIEFDASIDLVLSHSLTISIHKNNHTNSRNHTNSQCCL